MRELAILTFVTLDGVMQAPKMPEEDTSNDFSQGGWADPYWDETMALVAKTAMAEPYDVLLGRRTYDMFAIHQSSDDSPLNHARKYVVTSRSSGLSWQHSTALTGDVAAEVSELKQGSGPLIQVHGSWQLIQALLAHDLIDEFRLYRFPVILGQGKRLFGDRSSATTLRLSSVASTPNGVQMSIYRKDQ